MNLTNCPACQKQISVSAETCPHCGHPIKKIREQKNSLITMIAIMIICLVVFFAIKLQGLFK